MIRGYLLDTNHVDAFARRDAKLMARIQDLLKKSPQTQIRVPSISFGETEAGHCMNPSTDHVKREECYRIIRNELRPLELEVTANSPLKKGISAGARNY